MFMMYSIFLFYAAMLLAMPCAYSMSDSPEEESLTIAVSPLDDESSSQKNSEEKMEKRLKELDGDAKFQEDFKKLQQADQEYRKQANAEFQNELTKEEKNKYRQEVVKKIKMNQIKKK